MPYGTMRENALQMLLPGACAGRVIGRQGTRIQEVQQRSASRIRLTDHGADKLLRITGSWAAIEAAVALVLEDVLHRDSDHQDAWLMQSKQPPISLLLPEEVAKWVDSEDGRRLLSQEDAVSITVGGVTGTGGTEQRVKLQGGLTVVRKAAGCIVAHLRRHARWAKAGAVELAHEVHTPASDFAVPGSFVSTLNFKIEIPQPVLDQMESVETLRAFSEEVQEDTGAVLRILSDTGPGTSQIVVAGQCASKITALHEVALLLAHKSRAPAAGVGPDAEGDGAKDRELTVHSCSLKLMLPADGPGAMSKAEVKSHADGLGVGASLATRGGLMAAKLLCTVRKSLADAAVAIYAETERRAWQHEQQHGPPALLIDYLAKWCLPMRGGGSRRLMPSDLPLQQITSCERLRGGRSGASAWTAPPGGSLLISSVQGVDEHSAVQEALSTPAPMSTCEGPQPANAAVSSTRSRASLRKRLAAFGPCRPQLRKKRRRKAQGARTVMPNGRGGSTARKAPALLHNPLLHLKLAPGILAEPAEEEEAERRHGAVLTACAGPLVQGYSDDEEEEEDDDAQAGTDMAGLEDESSSAAGDDYASAANATTTSLASSLGGSCRLSGAPLQFGLAGAPIPRSPSSPADEDDVEVIRPADDFDCQGELLEDSTVEGLPFVNRSSAGREYESSGPAGDARMLEACRHALLQRLSSM